jgi:hypothetical protein
MQGQQIVSVLKSGHHIILTALNLIKYIVGYPEQEGKGALKILLRRL